MGTFNEMMFMLLCSFISPRSIYSDISVTPSGIFQQEFKLVHSVRNIAPRRKLREINSGATVTSKCNTDQAKYVTFDKTLQSRRYIFFLFCYINISSCHMNLANAAKL